MKFEKSDREWAKKLLDAIVAKELEVTARNQDKIPYTTIDGVFDNWDSDEKICWWTNGFWAGLLWLLYDYSKVPIFKETAELIERKLDRNLMNYRGLDHDNGFKWLHTAV